MKHNRAIIDNMSENKSDQNTLNIRSSIQLNKLSKSNLSKYEYFKG